MGLQDELDKLAPVSVPAEPRDALRILLLDIETYPALTWQWSLRDEWTPPTRILQDDGMLSWAAKWYGDPDTEFRALWTDGGPDRMARDMHALLCEADAVVTYNGIRFDEPWLRRVVELESGLGPVSPFKSVDLIRTARRFKYLSKSLAFMCERLEVGHKVDHEGFSLWPKAMPTDLIGGQGDPQAQANMEEYNRGDVAGTLEPLYDALLPWIKGHPHVGLWTVGNVCQQCGHDRLVKAGTTTTPLGVYQRFQCAVCRSWHRGRNRLSTVDARRI